MCPWFDSWRHHIKQRTRSLKSGFFILRDFGKPDQTKRRIINSSCHGQLGSLFSAGGPKRNCERSEVIYCRYLRLVFGFIILSYVLIFASPVSIFGNVKAASNFFCHILFDLPFA